MDDFTCAWNGHTWFCTHDCDDPSHGRQGPALVYIKSERRYYRDGGLISITDL